MSSGHRHTDAAPVGQVVRLIQMTPGLQAFLSRPPIISRKYLVPYGAGRSTDGSMVYIDEGVPERFKMGVEPDQFVSAHEGMEFWLMTRKSKDYWVGPEAKSAHWWATGYEHMRLKLAGYSDDEIAAYEKEWDIYISADEAQRLTPETVPPDLYLGPYDESLDDVEADKKIDRRILPILQAAAARVLTVQNARAI
jgi:hypothetical protein